jgi:hypothetical protein
MKLVVHSGDIDLKVYELTLNLHGIKLPLLQTHLIKGVLQMYNVSIKHYEIDILFS